MQINSTKKSAEALFLLFAEEGSSNEGRELFMGLRAFEVFSPTIVEFHKTWMGLVAKDDLCISAGLFPIASLACFARGKRMFIVVTFVLDKDLVRTGTGLFTCEWVMEMFFLGDRDVIDSLWSCFFECAGDAIDPVADSAMCHKSKGNN